MRQVAAVALEQVRAEPVLLGLVVQAERRLLRPLRAQLTVGVAVAADGVRLQLLRIKLVQQVAPG